MTTLVDAIVIPVDAEPYPINITEPGQLLKLQEIVGGDIMAVRDYQALEGLGTMFVNEDGVRLALSVNHTASRIAGREILGQAILCGYKDWQGELRPITSKAIPIAMNAWRAWQMAKAFANTTCVAIIDQRTPARARI